MESDGAKSTEINIDIDPIDQIKAESAVERVQTQRFESVTGFGVRVNDIIYCPPEANIETKQSPHTSAETTLVYFGGDVQDYGGNMEKQRDGKKYIEWNLENTALLLHKKFPAAHIAVVKPSRMNYLTFSCYDNFVNCNDFGIPVHCPNYFAISHLEKLLQNMKNRLNGIAEIKETNNEAVNQQEGVKKDCNDLILIGFSKGCIVLNQMVGEFHHRFHVCDNSETGSSGIVPSNIQAFRARIREMYWLDGGHSGGRNTWITNKLVLKTLADLRIVVYVHVTPYQVEDERRPWIRKEERIFTDTLTQYGATLHRVMHFCAGSSEANSSNIVDISTHFSVLKVFKSDIIIK